MLASSFLFFFFNDTATTEIYTLSLHDALPICHPDPAPGGADLRHRGPPADPLAHHLSTGLHDDLDVVPGPGALDPGPNERGGISGRQLTGPEPDPGPVRRSEPVQPVAPPSLPVQVVADQVPAAAEQHEAMRFDVPPGLLAALLAAGRGVGEPDPFGVPAGE